MLEYESRELLTSVVGEDFDVIEDKGDFPPPVVLDGRVSDDVITLRRSHTRAHAYTRTHMVG